MGTVKCIERIRHAMKLIYGLDARPSRAFDVDFLPPLQGEDSSA